MFQCECSCACVCVCMCERGRDRERARARVCVKERDRDRQRGGGREGWGQGGGESLSAVVLDNQYRALSHLHIDPQKLYEICMINNFLALGVCRPDTSMCVPQIVAANKTE